MRFVRLILAVWGLFLFTVTAIQWVQPPADSRFHTIIYTNLPGGTRCCAVYRLDLAGGGVARVNLPLATAADPISSISPSGRWRLAFESNPTGWRRLYLMPHGDNPARRIALPPIINTLNVQWSQIEDRLYYLQPSGGGELLLHDLTPERVKPRRLASTGFFYLQALSERPLPPPSAFTPLLLFYLSVNLLLVATGLPYLGGRPAAPRPWPRFILQRYPQTKTLGKKGPPTG